jgi:hypothetical protein
MEPRLKPDRFERRNGRRRSSPEDHGLVAARIRPGNDVEVVDVSQGGVLVDSRHRLLPGTIVELYLRREHHPATVVRGHVLRCAVVHLDENTISYRGAIAFERALWSS